MTIHALAFLLTWLPCLQVPEYTPPMQMPRLKIPETWGPRIVTLPPHEVN
jgi:hypothetical protein